MANSEMTTNVYPLVPDTASIRRAAFAAVCFCKCEVQVRCNPQFGVTEEHRELDELDPLRNQQACRTVTKVVRS